MINFLIANRSWPDKWKCDNLTPVFKKDEDTRKENYRPVSVLTALSKVYEKVMYDQLYNTFCRHLSQNLSRFLKNHSCCTALLKMTEEARLPQGSLLGLLLFNIFINDLNYAVPDVSLRLYADNTTLYASDVSPIAPQFVVNRGLSRLSEWFDAN